MVDSPAPAPASDAVPLTDLEVIARYSLALRTATVDRAELVRVLRDDLEWLTAGAATSPSAPSPAVARRAAP